MLRPKHLLAITAAIVFLVVIGVIATGHKTPFPQNSDNVHPSAASTYGGIEGYAFDNEGRPVNRAVISLERVDSLKSLVPSTSSDEQGSFRFSNLRPGVYRIHGGKEEDGYPNSMYRIYSGGVQESPQVTITNNQVVSNVIIRLGPKAAKLKGIITDAETGLPIENARITLSCPDVPNSKLMTGPNKLGSKGVFELLAPSRPFSLEVEADGYEDWYYPLNKTTGALETLRMSPEVTSELNVKLQRRARK
jgi:hypothetical protein